MQSTINLFENAAKTPGSVRRYKSEASLALLGGKPKVTKPYPFPPFMMKEFIDAFELIDPSKKESALVAWEKTHQPLLEFLKKNCDRQDSVELTGKVLQAMMIMLGKHPGSLLHELIALHQVRNSINFNKNEEGSNTHRVAMREREKKVFETILKVWKLLDDSDISRNLLLKNGCLERALGVIQQHAMNSGVATISIDECKEALLILRVYRPTAKSYRQKLFDSFEHNRNIFHFLIDLNTVNNANTASEVLSYTERALGNSLLLHSVDLTDVSNVKFYQLKQLKGEWEKFFLRDKKKYLGDLVAQMTDFLMDDDVFGKNIERMRVWHGILREVGSNSIVNQNYPRLCERMGIEPKVAVATSDTLAGAGENSFFALDRLLGEPVSRDSTQQQLVIDQRPEREEEPPVESAVIEERDAPVQLQEPEEGAAPFLESESTFASEFIEKFKECLTNNNHCNDLIKMTLQFCTEALQLDNRSEPRLLEVYAFSAQRALDAKLRENKQIKLQEIYGDFYTIFQAITVSSRQLINTTLKQAMPFYQNASVILLQLGRMISPFSQGDYSEDVKKLHESMLETRCAKDKTELQTLTHYLDNKNFAWADIYNKPGKERAEKRRYYEALCVYLLVDLLNRDESNITLEEKWLIVKTREASKAGTESLFYNALSFIAAVPPVLKENALYKEAVLITNESLMNQRRESYITRLCEKYPQAHSISENKIEKQDFQQSRLEKERLEIISALKLSADGKEHDETDSVGSQSTSKNSILTGSVALSTMTGRRSIIGGRKSVGSLYSSRSHKTENSQDDFSIVTKNWEELYNKFGVPSEAINPIESMTEVNFKFIIKNFAGIYQNESTANEEERPSIKLLHKAFEMTQSTVSLKRTASASPSMYGKVGAAKDVPLDEVNLMPYFAPLILKKGEVQVVPYVFAMYCTYMAERKKHAYEVKSHEIEFMMKNLRHLYMQRDALNEFSLNLGDNAIAAAANIIAVEWDKQLKSLEAQATNTLTEVLLKTFKKSLEQHRNARLNAEGKHIKFETPLDHITDRINRLAELAKKLEKDLTGYNLSTKAKIFGKK